MTMNLCAVYNHTFECNVTYSTNTFAHYSTSLQNVSTKYAILLMMNLKYGLMRM